MYIVGWHSWADSDMGALRSVGKHCGMHKNWDSCIWWVRVGWCTSQVVSDSVFFSYISCLRCATQHQIRQSNAHVTMALSCARSSSIGEHGRHPQPC